MSEDVDDVLKKGITEIVNKTTAVFKDSIYELSLKTSYREYSILYESLTSFVSACLTALCVHENISEEGALQVAFKFHKRITRQISFNYENIEQLIAGENL